MNLTNWTERNSSSEHVLTNGIRSHRTNSLSQTGVLRCELEFSSVHIMCCEQGLTAGLYSCRVAWAITLRTGLVVGGNDDVRNDAQAGGGIRTRRSVTNIRMLRPTSSPHYADNLRDIAAFMNCSCAGRVARTIALERLLLAGRRAAFNMHDESHCPGAARLTVALSAMLS